MDQNEYPRPDYTSSGPYAKDKSWGIAIIVFSILGICLGGLAVAGGGLMSAVGATGAATAGAAGAGRASGDSAAVGLGGGLVMLLGGGLLLLSIVRLVGGIGVLRGQKWGFLISAVVSGLLILMNLASLPSGIISIVISGIILYYCYSRLSGKEGPTPV